MVSARRGKKKSQWHTREYGREGPLQEGMEGPLWGVTLEEAETQLHGKCIQGGGRGQQMLPSYRSPRGLVELELQLPRMSTVLHLEMWGGSGIYLVTLGAYGHPDNLMASERLFNVLLNHRNVLGLNCWVCSLVLSEQQFWCHPSRWIGFEPCSGSPRPPSPSSSAFIKLTHWVDACLCKAWPLGLHPHPGLWWKYLGRCLFVQGFSIHWFLREEEESSWEKSLKIRLRTKTPYRVNKSYNFGA